MFSCLAGARWLAGVSPAWTISCKLLDPPAVGLLHKDRPYRRASRGRPVSTTFSLDRAGEVIYVGKADNLRTGLSHISHGGRSSAGSPTCCAQLHRIDHRVCVNTLEAEVTELRLIHAHRPRFNQRSRPPRRELFVKITDEAFPRLVMAMDLRTLVCGGWVRFDPSRQPTW